MANTGSKLLAIDKFLNEAVEYPVIVNKNTAMHLKILMPWN